MKNGTPTQPNKQAKIKKFSWHLEFYRKFGRILFVIWPTPCQENTIYIHIHQIDPSVGYPNRISIKMHSRNKIQPTDFPTMSRKQKYTYTSIIIIIIIIIII